MDSKLPALIKGFFICLVAYAFPFATAYAAPSLLFDPSATSVAQNTTFQEKITINVESNLVQSSDAIVSYAGDELEVTSVTSGGFFPEFGYANNPAGTLEIHGYTTTSSTITGTGTLATIVFKAKRGSGSSAVSFTCTGGTNNTNILTTGGTNILSCSQVNQLGISYTGGGGGATNTPTPTPTHIPGATATPTFTPTPTQITGYNTPPSCTNLTTDITSAVGTPLSVTLTCAGSDANGTLTASEFIFGDGTSQVVEKSAGSSGSISTTHTYTTIGTLGASCRMRDNNQSYSTITDSCKKIITIKQKTNTTTTSTTTTKTTGSTTTTVKTTTPTPAVVAIISETPEPQITIILPSPETTQAPAEAPQQKDWLSQYWWIAAGGSLVFVALLLLRKRKPKHTNMPVIPPTTVNPNEPPTV